MNKLWVERHRPTSIPAVIFENDQQRAKFQRFVDEGQIPNLLLFGGPGTGKTTISRALINDLKVDPVDVLLLKCSDEKIEALREKAVSFALTYPVGKFKIVRLEEFDYLSLEAQALLRALIEDTSATCRFVATCNYVNRVIPPLRSRFQEFALKAPNLEQTVLRAVEVLNAEKIEYVDTDLIDYVDAAWPDLRKVLQLLEQNSQAGKLLPAAGDRVASDWKLTLLDNLRKGDWLSTRKVVCQAATKEEHEDVFRFLYTHVDQLKVKDKNQAIVIIAEYLWRHQLIADTEINLAAACIELSRC